MNNIIVVQEDMEWERSFDEDGLFIKFNFENAHDKIE